MQKYRIINWSAYNRALIQRGNITLWFSDDTIQKWRSSKHTCQKGRPQTYSDDAILCALMIRFVYHLPLRALVGFLLSLMSILQLDLPVPSYSQISRRSKTLEKILKKLSKRLPSDLVFDSTGLKVYGEGEWKVKIHGKSKRRTWKKFHIGIDPGSQEIIVAELTDNGEADAKVAQVLLDNLPKTVRRVYGDGAYDGFEFRRKAYDKGAKVIVPPPKDAAVHPEAKCEAIQERNEAVLQILGLGGNENGRKLWKKLTRYHTRSLVETAIYRFKQLTGDHLRTREWERQRVETIIKCIIINKMTQLGMPKGVCESIK